MTSAISSGVVERFLRSLLLILRFLNASLKHGVSLVSTEDGLTVLNRIDCWVADCVIDQ